MSNHENGNGKEVRAGWTPPENPDLRAILEEAQRDTSAGLYADALAKHIWFHRNANQLQPSLYGVRLSFALAYWKALADLYPPAFTALIEMRNEAEAAVRGDTLSGDALRDAFHDFEAINKQLGETGRTRDLFVWLDEHKPDAARQFYRLAQPALIQSKEYLLCGKFLDWKAMYEWSLKRYQNKKDLAEDPKHGINLRLFGEKCFSNEIAILVGLLVVNGRYEEAERVGIDALNAFENEEFEAMLEASMRGVVPDPWP